MQSGSLRFLSSFFIPFRFQIIYIFFAIILVSSSILGLGYALKYLIDLGFVSQSSESLNYAFLMLLAIIILISLSSYFRSLKVNWLCEQLEAKIKEAVYKNAIILAPSYYERNKLSDIYSRFTVDVNLICNNLVTIFSYSFRNCIMALGGLILLFVNNMKLTSYVLMILPLVLIPIIVIGKKVRQLSKRNQQYLAEANSQIEESLNYIAAVQSYNQEKFEVQKYTDYVKESQNIAYQRIQLRSLLFALVISLILSAIAFVLWVGGQDVLAGEMTAGSLSSFIYYSVLVASSIGGLSETYSDWQRAKGALDRVFELAEAKSPILEAEQTEEVNLTGDFLIKIDNLSFFYQARPEIKVLENINFEIKNGETIAIVGPSGAGKSTIFKLMERFYDPCGGRILIDKVDIRELKLSALRDLLSFVTQDPIIFTGTVAENIRYGKIDATEQEVIEAAKAAEIFDFFDNLQEGLNTYVGEKGTKLSGGQKQRIAIARAILKNPKILLLDEATSSLDNENEKLVQMALDRLSKDRTTIVIAHRISTIINSDKIIVLNEGKIEAIGTHQELLSSCELYQRLNQNNFIYSD